MTDRAAPGWVYVLTHPAWDKLGMVKIGKTGRDPRTRAAEIACVSGLLSPCTIAWCSPVSDMAAAEAAVHRMLGGRRVRKRRELFRVDVATARRVVETVADSPGCSLGRRISRQASSPSRYWFTRQYGVWRRGSRCVPVSVRVVAGLAAISALLVLLRPLLMP